MYGLMVLLAPIHDGLLVNLIVLAMKTVENFILMDFGMIYLVHESYRVTCVVLQVRFIYILFGAIEYSILFTIDKRDNMICIRMETKFVRGIATKDTTSNIIYPF